jgi:alpha-tubulin suppressor-like RCC1 family protein
MRVRTFGLLAGLLPLFSACVSDSTAPQPEAAPAAAAAPAPAFRQVSSGHEHTCGVTTENGIYCWGWNLFGTLGIGTNTGPETCFVGDYSCSTRPVAVTGGLRFRQVSAGTFHTCAITTDDRLYCWGYNVDGQIGSGTNSGPELCGGASCSTVPMAVASGLRFLQVAAGDNHACAVSRDQRAYCWGQNGEGELGTGTNTGPETCRGPCSTRPVPVTGGLRFRQLAAGQYYTCGVTTDDRVYCWGSNRYGQLGDSTEAPRRLSPTPVSGTRRFRQVAAGIQHTCAVTTGSRAFCWGDGRFGQLGNGKAYLSFWPRRVAGDLSFDRVTVGRSHTCGETSTNRGYCWGMNDKGQLGVGDTGTESCRFGIPCGTRPVAVVGGLRFLQLSASGYHTCGKTATEVVYCWGWNGVGQLGDGTETNRPAPTRVAGPL